MKVALVTGSAKRVGRDIALSLAKKGYNILLHYNTSKQEAKSTKKEIENYGVICHLIKIDLNKKNAEKKIIKKAYSLFDKIDIIINNASIYSKDSPENFETDTAMEQLKVNLIAPIKIMELYSKKQNSGLIINLLDKKCKEISTDFFSYSISKNILEQTTLIYSAALKNKIRVNGIAPQFVIAPKIDKKNPDLSKEYKKLSGTKPILNKIDEIINSDITGEIYSL